MSAKARLVLYPLLALYGVTPAITGGYDGLYITALAAPVYAIVLEVIMWSR